MWHKSIKQLLKDFEAKNAEVEQEQFNLEVYKELYYKGLATKGEYWNQSKKVNLLVNEAVAIQELRHQKIKDWAIGCAKFWSIIFLANCLVGFVIDSGWLYLAGVVMFMLTSLLYFIFDDKM